MEVLSVKGLKKSFKTSWSVQKTEVLKDVNFKIHSGRVTGFLGANGAGKTTTIKCLLGLISPDQAEIRYFGSSELTTELRKKVGFLPERPYFYDYLTGFEFLKFYGELSTDLKEEPLQKKIEGLLKRVQLLGARDRPLRDYSKGMLQRIGVAQALIGNPELIILDEPMAGLDPDGRFEVSQIIKETAAQGTAVFFSSHLLNDVEKLCQDLVVLKNGRVVFSGETGELLGQFDATLSLFYRKGEKVESKKGLTPEEVNLTIDQLRAQNCEILEVKKEIQSLEQAFVNIGLREESEETKL